MKSSVYQLEEQYASYLQEVMSNKKRAASWDAAKWTTFVKETWAYLGSRHGFHAIYSKHPKEHLYDLCWIKETVGGNDTRWMQLALESEWHVTSQRTLLEDFLKLLDGKAPQKVYVFQSKQKRLESDIPLLSHHIARSASRMDDEKYLLIPHIDRDNPDGTRTETIQGYIVYPSGYKKKLGDPVDILLR